MIKRITLFITALSLLLSGVGFANPRIEESLSNGTPYNFGKSLQIELANQTIATSNSISVDLHNILHYDRIDIILDAVSAGTITTANVSWRMKDPNFSLDLASDTLTMGTGLTTMKSGDCRITIYNYEAASVTCTGSIMANDD